MRFNKTYKKKTPNKIFQMYINRYNHIWLISDPGLNATCSFFENSIL